MGDRVGRTRILGQRFIIQVKVTVIREVREEGMAK